MNENTINADVTMGGAEGTLLANRYRIVRQLGQGGMGSVWLAADTQLDNREVAIKMLPSILVSNKRAYQQLKAEALVSLKLTHPNIATVRAFEENGGNPFLVVDYIDGVTLDDYLAEVSGRADLCVGRDGARPSQLGLPEAEVIRLLTPIAAAIDYAHSKGIVHRDVKPGNVMIAKDGTPYILDFGIAREIQETMTRVTGKLSSGTLMYMSPEQLHGAAPKSSQDVYSFAAMAYECLMGTPPFSRGQIEYQIEHDSPAPLDSHIIISESVMAGLAKSPEDRPMNCASVLVHNPIILSMSAMPRTESDDFKSDHTSQSNPKTQIMGKPDSSAIINKSSSLRSGWQCCNLCTPPRSGESKHRLFLTKDGYPFGLFAWCPPGLFLMGSPDSDGNRSDDERQHYVTISRGFWIAHDPVDQRTWKHVMSDNPSCSFSERQPVENVTWNDCLSFCSKLRLMTGLDCRLPTESEWEYACRAGKKNVLEQCWEISKNCWCDDMELHHPHEIGKRKPNAWGINDMRGNIFEWCSDWYGEYPRCAVCDPLGSVYGTLRVCRGGCWYDPPCHCRSSSRHKFMPTYRGKELGFRIVITGGTR